MRAAPFMPDEDRIEPGQKPRAGSRLLSLDAVRGLIMILMAVDHASYFVARVHPAEFWGTALPRYADALAFLTRWVTHLCAPGFFFLMGTGMVLFAAARRQAGWTNRRIVRFFATRGILLILLQLWLENPAWLLGRLGSRQPLMDPPGGGGDVLLHFGVLYGLGATMLVCAFLVRARTTVIVLLSLGAVLATQWLTPSAADSGVLYSPWLRLLLIPGHTGVWQSFYPLVPWLGVTGLGILFGRELHRQGECAFRPLLFAGAGFLALFVVVRWAGGFGNFHPWESGWIGFFNVTKYPPSLAFLLVTLGLTFLLLFVFHQLETSLPRAGRPLLVFGRSPLFFYIAHLYVYGLMGLAFPEGAGYGVMYLFWLLGLIILFPLCVWYGHFKRRKPVDSGWKLF